MTAAALATRPTLPSAHPAPINNSDATDARLSALPLPAQAKFESLRRTEQRARAFIDGLFDERQRIREQRDEATRALANFDRAYKPESSFTSVEDEKTGERRRVPTVFPEREKLVKQIAFANAELARLSDEQRAANSGVNTEAILDWLAGQSPSTKFVAVPVKPVKGETLPAVRADQDALRNEIETLENAPRTAAEAKLKMRAEVAAITEKGKPDISGLFHGGTVRWPTQLLVVDGSSVHSHISSATVNDAHALAIWVNRAAIIAELDREIERTGDGANALTAEDQAAQLAERRATLLYLQRQEEAAIERLEGQGHQVRRTCANPIILLGIQAA